tara:strand:+ start:53 stop:250 length:198 start_codon:yes stop_codon:yes gene_type:complete
MNKYYEVQATNENEVEILFGSFVLDDCSSEIECEVSTWTDQGYKKIKIVTRLTNEKPDLEIYENY